MVSFCFARLRYYVCSVESVEGGTIVADDLCWCASGVKIERCCAPLLTGAWVATSAVTLMRSRYSAYVTENAEYLLRTWHPRTRPSTIDFDPQQRWLGLRIKRCLAGGVEDHTGEVEFVARFKIRGKGHRLHEISRFERLEGAWVYVDGSRG